MQAEMAKPLKPKKKIAMNRRTSLMLQNEMAYEMMALKTILPRTFERKLMFREICVYVNFFLKPVIHLEDGQAKG